MTGPARVFDSEDAAMAAIMAQQIKGGDIVVIRYEGRRAVPECAKCWRQPAH
jgi:dihydroxy-acid dehydratase